jgi:hypothetical protein
MRDSPVVPGARQRVSPPGPRSTRRWLLIALAAAMLAAGAAGAAAALPAGAPTARAVAAFSALEPPVAYAWGDCRIRIGPLYDAARAGRPDWRAYGAAEVDCARPRHRITVVVDEIRRSPGGATPIAATSGRRSARGASTGIVSTGAACRDERAAWWQTRARVTIDGRSSRWLPGAWSGPRGDGCGPR